MADKGRGFALGCGNVNSPVSILFERPAEDELAFILDTKNKPEGMSNETWTNVRAWREKEIARRKLAYPDLEPRFLLRGAPVRGASGAELVNWAFKMAGGGLNLEDCYLENVLHCAAPSHNEKELYPKGNERARAESCCSHWNRLLRHGNSVSTDAGEPSADTAIPLVATNVAVVSLHPAGLLKEKGGGIVALPLQADTFRKARSFAKLGRRVLVLAGGKAAKYWLGYAEAVTRWCGHFIAESEGTWQRRLKRIQDGLLLKTSGKTRKKKASSQEETDSTKSSAAAESKPLKRTRRKKPDLTGMASFGVS